MSWREIVPHILARRRLIARREAEELAAIRRMAVRMAVLNREVSR